MWGLSKHVDQTLIEELLAPLDIEIDGPDPCDVQVHNRRLFHRVLTEGAVGLGEAYVDRWWDCRQLDELFFRVGRSGLYGKLPTHLHLLGDIVLPKLVNFQTRSRSKVVAREHYDLGNDLYQAMLDPYLQYSCADFQDTDDLATAQRQKLEVVCRKLQLTRSDRLLDIGCGWGGLAKYAAEQFGCQVVGINISEEQVRFARKFCAGLPVEIIPTDYRDLTGQFDKIVSVGMFEHVGHKNYPTFLEHVRSLLKPDGLFLLHCIGQSQPSEGDSWINRYIFPNSEIPSQAMIAEAAAPLFVLEDWQNRGADYDRTLMAWHRNFVAHWPEFESLYGERFYRRWIYYLLSSAGGFRARTLQLWQIVLSPAGVLGGYAAVR